MFSSNMKHLLALLALLAAVCCWGSHEANATACTVGCVQYVLHNSFSGTTANSTVTGVVAGHGIRVWACLDETGSPTGTGISTLTIGGTSVTPQATASSGDGYICSVSYRANVSSGSNAVNLTINGTACTGCTTYAEEWADASTSAADGQNATFTTDGTLDTSLPCGSITTSGSNDNVEAILFQADSTAPTSGPAGFTLAYSATTFYAYYNTAVTAGTYNPSYSSASGDYNNHVVCLAITEAGGGGAVTSNRLLMGVGQ